MFAALAMVTAPVTAVSPPAPAVAHIKVGDVLPRFGMLRPGTRTYLRYRVMQGVWRPIDIWRREVSFEDRSGARRLRIVNLWTGATSAPSNLEIDSWFEVATFAPLTHERRLTRAEEVRNEGFLFAPGRVQALPTTPSNSRAEFVLETPQPVFNFETDMELLQTLPLANGYAARLRFYHPGGPPPADWVFRVVGSTRLQHAGTAVDCWMVTMSQAENPGPNPSRFFVAKQGQGVLRVEQPQSDGSLTVKMLVAEETKPVA
jgi:hypothetical protein